MNEKYKMKYLKYKNKYLILKNQIAGMHHLPMHDHDPCIICQEDMDFDNDEVRRCHFGGHFFHTACIEQWFARGHNTCPLCNNLRF
jgi:hypothetical protein